MRTDQFFRQLERRSERELFSKTSRIVYTSQRQLINSIKIDKKKILGRRTAIEVLWFFVACITGLLLGYALFLMLEDQASIDEILSSNSKGKLGVLYFSCAICFVGVYVTRVVMWSIQKV